MVASLGYNYGGMVVGIDEVGRGCWAGPLVAAAVVLDDPIPGLRDSKRLSAKRREELFAAIQESALGVGVGWVGASEIDKLGLTRAVATAMQRALLEIKAEYSHIIIDGPFNFLPMHTNVACRPHADDTEPAVSAASIVAKVSRDAYMNSLHERYSRYEFDKHKGYGTALHRNRLALYGASDLHRLSYRPVQLAAGRHSL